MTNKFSLLFYFSLASVITLIVSSLFYFPAPQNIFLLVLLVPLLLYVVSFHIAALTHHHSQKEGGEEIIKRVKRNIIYFSLGIFALNFSFFTTKQILFSSLPTPETSISSLELTDIKEQLKKSMVTEEEEKELLLQKLQTLSLDIAKLRAEVTNNDEALTALNLETILGTTSAILSPPPITSITSVKVKSSQWGLLDIFEDPQSSKVVGQIEYGNTYPVLKTEGEYFLINLDRTGNTTNRKGWIHSQFVTAS